jgi:hypothetical protein
VSRFSFRTFLTAPQEKYLLFLLSRSKIWDSQP